MNLQMVRAPQFVLFMSLLVTGLNVSSSTLLASGPFSASEAINPQDKTTSSEPPPLFSQGPGSLMVPEPRSGKMGGFISRMSAL